MKIEPIEGFPLEKPYFDGKSWVSPFNFLEEVREQMQFPEKVYIHDVTLRDGEQTPRISFTVEEKLALAQEMDKIGIPSIEPGLPVLPEDREVIKTLSQMKLNARITPLCRVKQEDVDAIIECGADGMVLEFGINPYLVKYAYKMTVEHLIEEIIRLSNYAKNETGMYIEFMGWDAFRIPSLEYIKRFFGEILERGSIDRITLADTFGMSHPLTMQHVYKKLREWFPGVPLGLHIHNDFGLATANALMAVACGADEIHCSFNSLGERAGNVATEEVTVALEHLLKVDTGIKLEGLARVSHMVAEVSKVRPGRNKPIVGDGIFEIESGIVIHILRMFQDTELGRGALLPYPPELVGRPEVQLVAGKGTGRNYVEMLLAERGIQATDEQVATLVRRIKDMAIILKNALPPSILEGVIQDVVGKGRQS